MDYYNTVVSLLNLRD